jgi:phosphinothricin acetyltransferase
MQDTTIRFVAPDDLEAVTGIYNHYVVHTPITFDLEPYTPQARRAWIEQFAPATRYQLYVAEREGRVVGYAGSVRFRPKAAYDTSVETTIYLDPAAQGVGLGARLYEVLFDALSGLDIHRVLAGITLPNDPSVALHRRFGFEQAGIMREVGRKAGRYWDVLGMDRAL